MRQQLFNNTLGILFVSHSPEQIECLYFERVIFILQTVDYQALIRQGALWIDTDDTGKSRHPDILQISALALQEFCYGGRRQINEFLIGDDLGDGLQALMYQCVAHIGA